MWPVHDGIHVADRRDCVQTLSYESWEFNMWNNIDAEYQYASIYYILFILLGPFILINVFIAGISSVFLQLRRKNEVRVPPSYPWIASKPASEGPGGITIVNLPCADPAGNEQAAEDEALGAEEDSEGQQERQLPVSFLSREGCPI